MVEVSNEIIFMGGLTALVVALLFILVWVIRGVMKVADRSEQRRLSDVDLRLPSLSEPVVVKQRSNVPKKALKVVKEEFTESVGEYNVLKTKSRFSVAYWRDWWHDHMNPDKIILINMELRNGFHSTFLVAEKGEGFKYKGGKYLFDGEMQYFHLSAKMYAYDYHQDLSIPLRRRVPVGDIKKAMDESGITEVPYALNPKTLERFAVSKIAEGILRGAELDDFFKFIRLMVIIILVVVVIHLLLFAQKSGIFQQTGLF